MLSIDTLPDTSQNSRYSSRSVPQIVIDELNIAGLPKGDVAPPLHEDHPTWDMLGDWHDPLKSRGGRGLPSNKNRVDTDRGPALLFGVHDHAMIKGERTWRDYKVNARVQSLVGYGLPSDDDRNAKHSRTGIVFRMHTVRHYYFFGIQAQNRIVLAYRDDQHWHVLASQDATCADRLFDLEVRLCGDGIHAHCREAQANPHNRWNHVDVSFNVTDSRIRHGKAGFRSYGQAQLYSLSIEMSENQKRDNDAYGRKAESKLLKAESLLPPAKKTNEIKVPIGTRFLQGKDIHTQGRNDLLFTSDNALIAKNVDGEILWEINSPKHIKNLVFSPFNPSHGRLIFAIAGEHPHDKASVSSMEENLPVIGEEILLISGKNGTILKRCPIPNNEKLDVMRMYDLSFECALDIEKGKVAIILREWRSDCCGGGNGLWAYDGDLNLLWSRRVDPDYGHHNAVHLYQNMPGLGDVVLAGGTLIDAQSGQLVWVHDQAEIQRTMDGAKHYDASILGCFSKDDEIDPLVFTAGGDIGVSVIDALTGSTLARHEIGHAQWITTCQLHHDLPGKQVLCGTRWGNFGILTLFSGKGEKLWSAQHDYIGEGTRSIRWGNQKQEYIWLNTTKSSFGLYDHRGEAIHRLLPMREHFKSLTKAPVWHIPSCENNGDTLAIQDVESGSIHFYRAEE